MTIAFRKIAILGATGPTGIHLARILIAGGAQVRVVSRSADHLERVFGEQPAERVAADMLDAAAALQAIEGCDGVFDCIGLPAEHLADHPRTARNVAAAIARTGARAVHVSSYWAYLPVQHSPVSETHPRSGGSFPVRMRREAEDVLLDAGAAVLNLPDFYGSHVHTGTLQNVLGEAAAGKTMHCVGSPDAPREYAYVPDAMEMAASVATHEAAYGERWIIPGAGPVSMRRVAQIASAHLARSVKVQGAGPLMLRMLSLFNRELRGFMPMVPYYVRPIAFDTTKLRALLGEVPATPYESAIPATLDWLMGR